MAWRRTGTAWQPGLVLAVVLVGAFGAALAGLSREGTAHKDGHGSPNALIEPLPASLAALFPPRAERPVYLLEMLELGARLSRIAVDVAEQDWANTAADFDAFRQQYDRVAALVPEWTGRFPDAALADLGQALEARDRDRASAAHDKIINICHACHVAAMSRVQFQFHWGNFAAVSVTDPGTGEKITFGALMTGLDQGLAGIGADLAQAQRPGMQAHFERFNQRFQLLKETCKSCHRSERKYYVSAAEQIVVDQLGTTLKAPTVDAAKVRGLVQRIGADSCFGCHLVHVPAAYSRHK